MQVEGPTDQSELSENVVIQRYCRLLYLTEVVVMCVVGIDERAENEIQGKS